MTLLNKKSLNLYIEEEQTTQWPKENKQKDTITVFGMYYWTDTDRKVDREVCELYIYTTEESP
jgi:hypothetical protein